MIGLWERDMHEEMQIARGELADDVGVLGSCERAFRSYELRQQLATSSDQAAGPTVSKHVVPHHCGGLTLGAAALLRRQLHRDAAAARDCAPAAATAAAAPPGGAAAAPPPGSNSSNESGRACHCADQQGQPCPYRH